MYARLLLWPVVVLLAILLYLPGTTGPFLFDDFSNLDALGAHGGIKSWESFWLYLSQGHSGPTGRPISLISFLINDNGWPSVAYSFKYTNILIHALNGSLLFLVQLKLLERNWDLTEAQRFWLAFLGSVFWLFHPLFVSSVLYVVQRMAMLAATFVLLGLLSHIYFRSLLEESSRLAYLGMTVSMGLWGGLAVLSKENGALLPVLILVIESTVFSSSKRLANIWKAICLWMPTVLIMAYLFYVPIRNGLWTEWSWRDFSPYERLLTQSRIIWDYIAALYSFQGTEAGLFHDDFKVSRSIFSPVSTLFSLAGMIALFLVALVGRERWPLLSLAVLFYLAGHLVESTSIGLELYFEHRNYLPAFFAFLPLGQLVIFLGARWRWVWALVPVVLMLVMLLLFNRVDLWSSNISMALAWEKDAPESARAQRSAAIALIQEGYPVEALRILENASKRLPESHAILIHKLLLKCSLGIDIGDDKDRVLAVSQKVSFNPKLTNLVEQLVNGAASGQCSQLTMDYVAMLLEALKENPKAKVSDGFLHQVHYFYGLFYSHGGQPDQALESFIKATELRPSNKLYMLSIALLASRGACQQAADMAVLYESYMAREARGRVESDYYSKELERVKGNINKHCF